MGCDRCQELCVKHHIGTPADLTEAIEVARVHVANGTLREVQTAKPSVEASEPFAKVASAGPWNDFMSFAFACQRCGQRFQLTAETYHGSGGSWAPA